MAMSNNSDQTMVHLVLGGGGVQTLSYAGALNVLYENGIGFDTVSCCSAGTLIGALLVARGSPEMLVEDVQCMSLERLRGPLALPQIPNLFSLMKYGPMAMHPMLQWPFAMFSKSGFSEVFQERLGKDVTFGELQLYFATAGFDIVQRRYLVYDSLTQKAMKVSEALSIAVSYPFLYPPYEHDGRIIMDAGVASECPVWMAADQDTTLPIVALRPLKKAKSNENPCTFDAYTFYSQTVGSVSRGLDDYIIYQMPRVKLMEIDCGEIESHRFDLNKDERNALIEAGRCGAELGLQRFGKDLAIVDEQPTFKPFGGQYEEKALSRGDFLMTRFHEDLSKEVANKVFISYSHKDELWLRRVKKVFDKKYLLSRIWDDTRIEAGENWKEEIENALKTCRVAVLLLSPDFFESKVINNDELPYIIKAYREKELEPIPVFLWNDDDGWNASAIEKANVQAFNLGKPLCELSTDEWEAELNNLADLIIKKIQKGRPPQRHPSAGNSPTGNMPSA
jgi:predicted acylesterase/phospholipase RssA